MQESIERQSPPGDTRVLCVYDKCECMYALLSEGGTEAN